MKPHRGTRAAQPAKARTAPIQNAVPLADPNPNADRLRPCTNQTVNTTAVAIH